jgi:hypothetical protein
VSILAGTIAGTHPNKGGASRGQSAQGTPLQELVPRAHYCDLLGLALPMSTSSGGRVLLRIVRTTNNSLPVGREREV